MARIVTSRVRSLARVADATDSLVSVSVHLVCSDRPATCRVPPTHGVRTARTSALVKNDIQTAVIQRFASLRNALYLFWSKHINRAWGGGGGGSKNAAIRIC